MWGSGQHLCPGWELAFFLARSLHMACFCLYSAALARIPRLAFRSVETLPIRETFWESHPEEGVRSSTKGGSTLDPPWHQPRTLLSVQLAASLRDSVH